MEFFSKLAEKIEGYSLQLTITISDGQMNVMMYPKMSDKAEVQNKIVPLSLTGTPAEMDAEFFLRLGTPLDKAKEFANQLKSFDAGLDKAVKQANPKKDDKNAGVTITPSKPAEPTLMDQKPAEPKKEEPKAEAPKVEEKTPEPEESSTTLAGSETKPSEDVMDMDDDW